MRLANRSDKAPEVVDENPNARPSPGRTGPALGHLDHLTKIKKGRDTTSLPLFKH